MPDEALTSFTYLTHFSSLRVKSNQKVGHAQNTGSI